MIEPEPPSTARPLFSKSLSLHALCRLSVLSLVLAFGHGSFAQQPAVVQAPEVGQEVVKEAAEDEVGIDPWEASNRRIHAFNSRLDKAILKPLARAYRVLLPGPLKQGVGNFFRNISEIPSTVNKIFQGRPRKAAVGALRFLINSTMGVFGILDVASRMGLRREYEDFDQTLSIWGVPPGPYVVLPFFGPSTVRGAIGRVVDILMNPFSLLAIEQTERLVLFGANFLNDRAELLSIEFVVTGDEYEFYRNAYLQRRDYLINDGAVEDPFLEDEF